MHPSNSISISVLRQRLTIHIPTGSVPSKLIRLTVCNIILQATTTDMATMLQ